MDSEQRGEELGLTSTGGDREATRGRIAELLGRAKEGDARAHDELEALVEDHPADAIGDHAALALGIALLESGQPRGALPLLERASHGTVAPRYGGYAWPTQSSTPTAPARWRTRASWSATCWRGPIPPRSRERHDGGCSGSRALLRTGRKPHPPGTCCWESGRALPWWTKAAWLTAEALRRSGGSGRGGRALSLHLASEPGQAVRRVRSASPGRGRHRHRARGSRRTAALDGAAAAGRDARAGARGAWAAARRTGGRGGACPRRLPRNLQPSRQAREPFSRARVAGDGHAA